MEKVRVVRTQYRPEANILNVWFDDPKKEVICSETGEEVILRKDKRGHVIGFEMLNVLSPALWRKLFRTGMTVTGSKG